MKQTVFALGISALFLLACVGADADKAPENIMQHYEWCASATDAAALLARYEGFWKRHHPASEEYEDAISVRFVRLCAYRLAELYADSGNAKKCREKLKWLESQDNAIK